MSTPEGIPPADSRRLLARTLAGVGAVVVAVALVARLQDGGAVWVVVVGLVAVAAWLVDVVAPVTEHPVLWVLLDVRIVAGSIAGPPTDVLALVPGLIAVIVVVGSPTRSARASIAAPAAAVVLASVSTLVSPLLGAPVTVGAVISVYVALAFAVLVAISRRQFRAAELQSRQLLEQRVAVAQERERTAAFAERSRIARDIHDVLAHSLGGLVLQLDATEALLESGRVDDALARVRASRRLAAEGLDEARRAVDALHEDEPPLDLAAGLDLLVSTHRSLGARASLDVIGGSAPPPQIAAVLHAAAREALTNARRHAPGAETVVRLDQRADEVVLRASTPLVETTPSSIGGGRGLEGMRARIAAIGGTVTAGVEGDAFVVEARVAW
jgi:signal transduction histidine kinase